MMNTLSEALDRLAWKAPLRWANSLNEVVRDLLVVTGAAQVIQKEETNVETSDDSGSFPSRPDQRTR